MFALQIDFKDGDKSKSETILVKRSLFKIGASESAHVQIDELKSVDYDLEICRLDGSKFKSKPIFNAENNASQGFLENEFDGFSTIDFGSVSVSVISLDYDLRLKDTEVPDRAGVRILRQAFTVESPKFPAIVVKGEQNFVVSFRPSIPVLIGRANVCSVRIDAGEISNKHAKVGFESGKFWIEDLGSTNGTFLDGVQISGRTEIEPGVSLVLGRSFSIIGVNSMESLRSVLNLSADVSPAPSVKKFPLLLSTSDVARPARLALPMDGLVEVGRDPSSDIWLGAPHVSRKHCEIVLNKNGSVSVRDLSTNGTGYHKGILKHQEVLNLDNEPTVFDFGGDLTLAVCFTEKDEETYLRSEGSPLAFHDGDSSREIKGELDMSSLAENNSLFTNEFTQNSKSKVKNLFEVFTDLSFSLKLILIFAAFGCVAIMLIIFASIKALVF